MRARLVRFYGFSHKEVGEMPYKDLILYYKCITHIQADEMTNNITTSSAHVMNKKSMRDLQKRLDGLKYKEDEPVMSFEELARKQWRK